MYSNCKRSTLYRTLTGRGVARDDGCCVVMTRKGGAGAGDFEFIIFWTDARMEESGPAEKNKEKRKKMKKKVRMRKE